MILSQSIPYVIFYIIIGSFAIFRSNSRMSIFLILLASSLFIGLRYETGFDWTVYKEEFQVLKSANISLGSIIRYSDYFNHEFGYVTLTMLSSKVLFDYEQYQFFIFILFFFSLLSISRAMKSPSFSYSFLIIISFLMFTLVMSTMRQCVAIAMINFGLSFYIRGKVGKSLLFALLALSFHISSGIYILIFLVASILRIGGGASTFAYAAIGGIIVSSAIDYLPIFELPIISKLNLYISREFSSNLYERIFFVSINAVMMLHSLMMIKESPENHKFIYRSISIMSAISIALLPITTIRNRIFYENIILYSFIIYNSPYRHNIFKYIVPLFGIISFSSNFIKQSNIAYLPYQSYIRFSITGERGDGYLRQQQIYAIQREAAQ